MKKLPLLIIAFIVCHSGITQNSQVVKDYINTFREHNIILNSKY